LPIRSVEAQTEGVPMDEQQGQYGQSPYDQSGGYGQGTGEQAQAAAYSQGQQGQHEAEEDVEIDWQYSHEESIHISMDDLRSTGYEPPADGDSANSPSYIA